MDGLQGWGVQLAEQPFGMRLVCCLASRLYGFLGPVPSYRPLALIDELSSCRCRKPLDFRLPDRSAGMQLDAVPARACGPYPKTRVLGSACVPERWSST